MLRNHVTRAAVRQVLFARPQPEQLRELRQPTPPPSCELDTIHPWRPAHYHFRIEASGRPPLTTMLYLAGDPYLGVDVIDSIKERLLIDTSSGVVDFDFVLAA